MIQWGKGADRVRTDCLLACLLMVGKFYGKMTGLTVDDLSAQTYLIHKDVGLQPEVGVTVGLLHGLGVYVHRDTTPEQIRAEIDAGRPVIVLVHYGLISNKPWDKGDNNPLNDGHFLVIGGYSYKVDEHGSVLENAFDCFDPNVIIQYKDKGRNILYSVEDITSAMQGYGSKCLFAKENQNMSLKEEIHALLNQAAAKVDLLPDEVTPPTTAVPRACTVNGPQSSVNVRTSPTGAVVKLVTNDTPLKVIDSGTFNWSKITEGTFQGVSLVGDVIYTPYVLFS